MTGLRQLAIREAFEADIPAANALDRIRTPEGLTREDMQRGTSPQWVVDEVAKADRMAADDAWMKRRCRDDGLGRFAGLQNGDLVREPFRSGLHLFLAFCAFAGAGLVLAWVAG